MMVRSFTPSSGAPPIFRNNPRASWEVAIGSLGEGVAELPGHRGLQRFAQYCPDGFHQALAHLQRYIADEAVAYDDVGDAGI